MLYAYRIQQGSLEQVEDPALHAECDWLDLVAPDEAERALVDVRFGEVLPTADDMEELEASSRYFTDEDGIHVHSLYVPRRWPAPEWHRCVHAHAGRLLSSRDNEMPDFRLMRLRVRNARVLAESPLQVLLALLAQKVDHLADELEELYATLEAVSQSVLKEDEDGDRSLEDDIDELAEIEDTNGKVRLCLLDTQRSVSFLMRHIREDNEALATCREILRDAESLLTHTTFVFEKVNFLMAAAQGFISIQQNQIIKIFSIAAVVFLPPTLVASIYGMNFAFMPELQWKGGYPFALGLMVLAGMAPYLFFKRKGWL